MHLILAQLAESDVRNSQKNRSIRVLKVLDMAIRFRIVCVLNLRHLTYLTYIDLFRRSHLVLNLVLRLHRGNRYVHSKILCMYDTSCCLLTHIVINKRPGSLLAAMVDPSCNHHKKKRIIKQNLNMGCGLSLYTMTSATVKAQSLINHDHYSMRQEYLS